MNITADKDGNKKMYLTTYECSIVMRALANYENTMAHAADLERSIYPDGGHESMFRGRAETAMALYRHLAG